MLEGKPMDLELVGRLNELTKIYKYLPKRKGYHVSYFKCCSGSTSLQFIKLSCKGQTC